MVQWIMTMKRWFGYVGFALWMGSMAPACGSGDSAFYCSEASCSGHGTCRSTPKGPTCSCDPGYRPEGLRCVASGDAGTVDGGRDGGFPDSGSADSGLVGDAGMDAGDAGMDAGDAGIDAGMDAGECMGPDCMTSFPPPPPRVTDCTYHVAIDGDDAADGSDSTPWRSIAKANSSVSPGDTVCIHSGAYDETIAPARSGTAEAPIIFAAFGGEQVHVRGSSSGNGSSANLQRKSFVILQGLDLSSDKLTSRGASVNMHRGHGLAMRWCRVVNPQSRIAYDNPDGVKLSDSTDSVLEYSTIIGWDDGVRIVGANHVVLRGNVIVNNVHNEIRTGGDGSTFGQLVEQNIVGGSLTADGFQSENTSGISIAVRGIILRRNLFYFNVENALDFKAAGNVVVEENLIVGTVGDNSGSGGIRKDRTGSTVETGAFPVTRGSRRDSEYVIIRRNVLYDNSSGLMNKGTRWHIYNNTIVGNNRDAYAWDSGRVSGSADDGFKGIGLSGRVALVVNNIVVNHNHAAVYMRGGRFSGTIDNNLYNDSRGRLRFLVQKNPFDFSGWQSASGGDKRSIVASPGFKSLPETPYFEFKQADPDMPTFGPVVDFGNIREYFAYDFRLRSGSSAIDAGRPIARARSTGSGLTLPVDDASVFADGYGFPGLADSVVIGSGGESFEIAAVDIEANELTLMRPASWVAGDPVTLPYTGAAPDIGACEYGAEVGVCMSRLW